MTSNKNSTAENNSDSSSTSRLVDSVDQMVRLPLEMTGATWDLMKQGVQSMTGMTSGNSDDNANMSSSNNTSTSNSTGTSGPSLMSTMTGQADQDLSGDELKYVLWSIVFTKPGFECVLEPQHEELVNYSADSPSFAALKIAKFLECARHGRAEKPESWGESYQVASKSTTTRRTEPIAAVGVTTEINPGVSASSTAGSDDRGWRIPAEDQKYITFLYRVDRRLPRQDSEVVRVERVTIERGGTMKSM